MGKSLASCFFDSRCSRERTGSKAVCRKLRYYTLTDDERFYHVFNVLPFYKFSSNVFYNYDATCTI